MVTPLFFGLIGLLGGVYIWIGNRASKNLETSDDYFLMGRKLSFFSLALTLLATQLGGGSLLGAAQEAYQNGWLVLFYPLGACVGLLILGSGYGGKLRQLNISTVAEIFEKVYQSSFLRRAASSLSIISQFFVLVAQALAAKLFFTAVGIQDPLIFIGFWFVLVAYTIMGGFKAVVKTDILQALFIIGVLSIAFVMSTVSTPLATIEHTSFQLSSLSKIPWSTWFFMPLLFMLIEQDVGQRCFAAKNKRTIRFSAFIAGITLLFGSLIAIYFGIAAQSLGIQNADSGSILIESVQRLTSPFISTTFMVAIFTAIISTADSLLCSVSSNLSCDFFTSPKLSQAKKIKFSRLITLIIGIISLGLSFILDNIVSVLMLSYELSVSALFVPVIAALYLKNPNRLSAYLSIIFGLVGFVTFQFTDLFIPKELLTLAVSAGGYTIGQKIKQKTSESI